MTYIYSFTDNGIKENQLEKLDYKIKYLFIGDSHMQNGVNPEYFENAYNFAASNENYAMTYFKLKAFYEDLNKEAEIVLLPIDIASFSSFRSSRYKISNLIDFDDCIDLYENTGDFNYIKEYFVVNTVKYSGKYTLINRFLARKFFGNSQKYIKGFKPRTGFLENKKNVDKICEKQADLFLKGHEYFDKLMIHYFKNILTLCEQKRIKLVLLKLPLYDKYINACRKYVPLEKYYNDIEKITHQYGNVTILDYQDAFKNNGEYFRNPDHMNVGGAKVFSELLSKDLKKIE